MKEEEYRGEVPLRLPHEVQVEINRIKQVARLYDNLQDLLPDYTSEYLDAFSEIADRFKRMGG